MNGCSALCSQLLLCSHGWSRGLPALPLQPSLALGHLGASKELPRWPDPLSPPEASAGSWGGQVASGSGREQIVHKKARQFPAGSSEQDLLRVYALFV